MKEKAPKVEDCLRLKHVSESNIHKHTKTPEMGRSKKFDFFTEILLWPLFLQTKFSLSLLFLSFHLASIIYTR